jgi:hypothetical protein
MTEHDSPPAPTGPWPHIWLGSACLAMVVALVPGFAFPSETPRTAGPTRRSVVRPLSATVDDRWIPDQRFNDGWLFYKGMVDAQDVTFDDRTWQAVDLPHDWAIAGPFSSQYDARTGGLPITGTGTARFAARDRPAISGSPSTLPIISRLDERTSLRCG